MITIASRISDLQLHRFLSQISPPDAQGCALWTGRLNLYGSGACAIQVQDYGTVLIAHRLSYMLAKNTELPRTQNIRHDCGQVLCQNPEHMTLVSKGESTRLAAQTRTRTGVTTQERAEILRLRASGLSLPEISRHMRISYKTIWATCAGLVGHKRRGRPPGSKNRRH